MRKKFKKQYITLLKKYFIPPKKHMEYEEEYFKSGELKLRKPVEITGDVIWTENYYDSGSLQARIPVGIEREFPTFEGFAAKLAVDIKTLDDWCRESEEFKKQYDIAKLRQEDIWVQRCLSGELSATIANLIGKMYLNFDDSGDGNDEFDINIKVVR